MFQEQRIAEIMNTEYIGSVHLFKRVQAEKSAMVKKNEEGQILQMTFVRSLM